MATGARKRWSQKVTEQEEAPGRLILLNAYARMKNPVNGTD
jgi:hypothetical protein